MSESEGRRAGLVPPWPDWERDNLVPEETVVERLNDQAGAAIDAEQFRAAWGLAVAVGNWEWLGDRRKPIMDAVSGILDRIEGEDDRSRRWG